MSKKKTTAGVIENRKAFHDYHIEEKFVAGLSLYGWEVKSLRAQHGHLKDSYITIKKGECWLISAHIPALNTTASYTKTDPTRPRKLLLNRREINKLFGQHQLKGLTIIPLRIFTKNKFIKVELALARGKKTYDKRQAEKEKTWKQDQKRALKNYTARN